MISGIKKLWEVLKNILPYFIIVIIVLSATIEYANYVYFLPPNLGLGEIGYMIMLLGVGILILISLINLAYWFFIKTKHGTYNLTFISFSFLFAVLAFSIPLTNMISVFKEVGFDWKESWATGYDSPNKIDIPLSEVLPWKSEKLSKYKTLNEHDINRINTDTIDIPQPIQTSQFFRDVDVTKAGDGLAVEIVEEHYFEPVVGLDRGMYSYLDEGTVFTSTRESYVISLDNKVKYVLPDNKFLDSVYNKVYLFGNDLYLLNGKSIYKINDKNPNGILVSSLYGTRCLINEVIKTDQGLVQVEIPSNYYNENISDKIFCFKYKIEDSD